MNIFDQDIDAQNVEYYFEEDNSGNVVDQYFFAEVDNESVDSYDYEVPVGSKRSRKQKQPRLPDELVSPREFERRERRRARNREAAVRQRDRRTQRVATLEDEVTRLKAKRARLSGENLAIRQEMDKLRFQLQLQEKQARISKPAKLPSYHEVVKSEETAPLAPETPLFDTATKLASSTGFVFPELKANHFTPGSLSDLL